MDPITTVGIVGVGPMGRGVAELLAARGLEVMLVSPSGTGLDQIRSALDMAFDHQIDKWAITEAEKRTALSRIQLTSDLDDLTAVDLVLETLTAELDTKEDLFRRLHATCAPGAILASNTSTLSITRLAAVSERPEQCIVLHFLSPVTRSRVVEVVRGLKTSDATAAACMSLLERLERVGVEVFESPGYITTRLLAPMINDAANLVLEGVATPTAIDTALRLGYHMERGPLEMGDRMGLDTLVVVLERLWDEYGDLRYRPSPLLRKLVRAGRTGVEAREGFFTYDDEGNRIDRGPATP